MESKFKSMSIFEFQKRFPDDRSCMKYLSEIKWHDGFVCKKCGHTHYCKGNKEFDRQCTRCNYVESPTAGTLFHKLKFSLLKAFWIIYYMSTSKKGISSTELSRKLQLRQKTAWLFQRKVKEAIVNTAYKLLIHKLAFGGLIAKNEASFQLEFGHILKTIGQLYEFRLTDKFHLEFETYINLTEKSKKSNSYKARVDLLLKYQDNQTSTKTAIELKFFKKENHAEPNNRYKVFEDISNLELYKENDIDLCYFILATDHQHYVNQDDYSIDTGDFDFRDKKTYTKGKVLQYRTKTPQGPDITLGQNYAFNWDVVNDFYFLKLKV